MRAPSVVHHSPPCDLPPDRDGVSHSYIQLVQHLIERCLLLYMDREECVKALSKYARVKPVVTVTVWKELEKSNKEFFVSYLKCRSSRQNRAVNRILEETTAKLRSQTLEDCGELR